MLKEKIQRMTAGDPLSNKQKFQKEKPESSNQRRSYLEQKDSSTYI